jgi:hypothetical protein
MSGEHIRDMRRHSPSPFPVNLRPLGHARLSRAFTVHQWASLTQCYSPYPTFGVQTKSMDYGAHAASAPMNSPFAMQMSALESIEVAECLDSFQYLGSDICQASVKPPPSIFSKMCNTARKIPRLLPAVGTANAARVSRGSEVDVWQGLSLSTPKRNPHEHVTITVVIYFTIAGGVPSEVDVVAAIDDMEALYDSCNASGRLADAEFDFMKSELTVKNCQDISAEIKTQPYVPASKPVANFDQFPADTSK